MCRAALKISYQKISASFAWRLLRLRINIIDFCVDKQRCVQLTQETIRKWE